MNFRVKQVGVMAVLLIGVCLSRVTASPYHEYKVRFGVLTKEAANFVLVLETSDLPNISLDSGFYFGIEIDTENKLPYVVKLVNHFPDRPPQLSGILRGLDLDTAAQHGVSFPEYRLTGKQIIPMGLDPGDPNGEYRLDVYIDGKLVQTIRYIVSEPKS